MICAIFHFHAFFPADRSIPDADGSALFGAAVFLFLYCPYAILDESVRWTGRQLIFVGKQQLGPVPRLAICQNLSGDLKDILVFYCNEQWEVLGCAGADTLEEAKVRAERAYEGITGKWIASNVTEEQAKSWIRDNCPDMSCSFCQREPMDFDNLIESKSGTTRICNYCIDEFHEWIHKPESDGSAT